MRKARTMAAFTLATAALLAGSACSSKRPGLPEPQLSWIVQASGTKASLRGLSVIDDRTAWASGSNGTVLKTLDGGATWTLLSVPGSSTTDFRDVEAFGPDEAVVMGIDRPASIFRTADGGKTWTRTFADDSPGVFLDGLAFFDKKRGLAVGDPMDGRFVLISTMDGGITWEPLPPASRPAALEGEAAFAASGTGLAVRSDGRAWLCTGGTASRVWRSEDRGRHWRPGLSALSSGSSSAGGFSVAFYDTRRGITVGGDYKAEAAAVANAAVSADGGRTWAPVKTRPLSGGRRFRPGNLAAGCRHGRTLRFGLFSRSRQDLDADRHSGRTPRPRLRQKGTRGLGGRPGRSRRQADALRVDFRLR